MKSSSSVAPGSSDRRSWPSSRAGGHDVDPPITTPGHQRGHRRRTRRRRSRAQRALMERLELRLDFQLQRQPSTSSSRRPTTSLGRGEARGAHVARSRSSAPRRGERGDFTGVTTSAGYFRAKVVQEALVETSSIPYTIVHATQFFEFLPASPTTPPTATRCGVPGRVSSLWRPTTCPPYWVAAGEPRTASSRSADPRPPARRPGRRFLTAKHDPREVVTDPAVAAAASPSANAR